MRYLSRELINLRKLAIKYHLSDDIDIYIEKAYRHFSKTYSTPLKEAYNMTPHEVLLVYMQDEMDELKKEELLDFLSKITEKNEPMLSSGITKTYDDVVAEDEAWIAEQNALLKKESEKKANSKDIIEQANKALEELGKSLNKNIDKDNLEKEINFKVDEE